MDVNLEDIFSSRPNSKDKTSSEDKFNFMNFLNQNSFPGFSLKKVWNDFNNNDLEDLWKYRFILQGKINIENNYFYDNNIPIYIPDVPKKDILFTWACCFTNKRIHHKKELNYYNNLRKEPKLISSDFKSIVDDDINFIVQKYKNMSVDKRDLLMLKLIQINNKEQL